MRIPNDNVTGRCRAGETRAANLVAVGSSAYKVATFRILSYFDAIAVSWIITLSPGQSLTYATINAVARPIMACANDIGWAGSGVGSAAASLQLVDFPDLGRDRL